MAEPVAVAVYEAWLFGGHETDVEKSSDNPSREQTEKSRLFSFRNHQGFSSSTLQEVMSKP